MRHGAFAPLRNNTLPRLSEDASKYQANDRGCYRSLIIISFGGYRLGARGFFHSLEFRTAFAAKEESRDKTTASALGPNCGLTRAYAAAVSACGVEDDSPRSK